MYIIYTHTYIYIGIFILKYRYLQYSREIMCNVNYMYVGYVYIDWGTEEIYMKYRYT